MEKKLFSIILPSYNCGELIRDTLESVIRQDESLCECIIVDGKSNDNTLDIIKQYSMKYKNIKYISEHDAGVYDAMNKGIQLANGHYLYFIGAGDVLYQSVLTDIENKINDEDLILGISYHVGKDFYFMPPKKKEDAIYLLFNHQAIFYKKEVFDIIGNYDSKYNIYADNVLNKKIFGNNNFKIKIIDIKIAKYLGNGISEKGFDENIKNDYTNIIIESFGKRYLYELYDKKINMRNVYNKKLIGWGTGGEYDNSCKINEFDLSYFVESFPNKKFHRDKMVLRKEELLKEDKEKIFIFVYSVVYFQEIRNWLEENEFVEFEHFILMNEDILKLLKELNLL